MGWLKDVYDIINNEPEAKAAMQKQLLKFMKGSSAKNSTIDDQIEKQKLLISSITESGYSNKFTELIDYFGVLLATIVGTTYLKHRGCTIRNFYCSEYHLYFPSPAEEPNMLKGNLKKHNEKARGLRIGVSGDVYTFYAFKSGGAKINLEIMNKQLTDIVRKSQASETELFLKVLKDMECPVIALQGIAQKAGEQRFWFVPESSYKESQMFLSFENPENIKQWLAEDLQKILDFQLIG